MAVPLAGLLTAVAPSILGNLFGGDSNTVTQQPLMTEQQKYLAELMHSFAKSGRYGGYKAGETYNGPLGDYSKSGLETTGQNKLMSMLTQGNGDLFNLGTNELNNVLSKNSIYNPLNSGIYDSFKTQARKNQAESQNLLDKSMASTGNFYSGTRNSEQRKLIENTNDTLNSKLAELYDNYAKRRLSAIPQAFAAQNQADKLNLANIAASQTYGSLDRTLADQAIQNKYNEWLRSRADMLTPLKLNQSNQQAPWGTPSMTVPAANPWQKVFDKAFDFVGDYLGSK